MKYLFGCEYKKNGANEMYYQTDDDTSKIEPSKSAYYDIMDKDIQEFWLVGDGHKYQVNLVYGYFEIDGIPFKMHEDEIHENIRLVYYRKHTHQFTGGVEDKHEIEFHFGWQANTQDGKNVKYIMKLK